MGRIKIAWEILKRNIVIATKGRLEYAKTQELTCGEGCVISSGTSFGSEPYLITVGTNVRLSGGGIADYS